MTDTIQKELTDHDRLVEVHTLMRDSLTPQVHDHESRIRKLEKSVWVIAGAAAAVGSAAGTSIAKLLGG